MSCSCQGKALFEIKCPQKYRNGLSRWDLDPGFPVSFDGCLDEGHPYYYQLQHHMLVTGSEKNYYYIWTKAKTVNFTLITFQNDNNFLKKLTEKFDHLLEVVILPELVSRKSAVENTEDEKLYCIC